MTDGWPKIVPDDDGLPPGERMILAGFDNPQAVGGMPGRDEPPPHDGDPGGAPPGPPPTLGDGPGPEGCPVVPLGTQGGRFYYLTRLGQMTYLRATQHGPLGIAGLFEGDVGPGSWLWQRFPETKGRGKREEQVGWNAEAAMGWLMRHAADCGIVDIASDIRGLGAWSDPDEPDRLIFHAGDGVLVGGEWRPPGRHGRHIYAGDRRIDRPGKQALSKADGERLLKLFGDWRYQGDSAIPPRLILGWLAAAAMPGALEWRPSAWFAGGPETGKTSLLFLLRQILGSTALGLAHLTDAGVRQALGVNALCVLVDEFEPQDLGPLVNDVMRFVRIASSGRSGAVVKGGMDGIPIFTTLVGCFGFSSIYRPPLTPQNRQRIAFVDMAPLDATSTRRRAFDAEFAWARRVGPALRRRVIDGWPRFNRLLAFYAEILETLGHSQRAREHFGTLLACADLLLADAKDDDGLTPEAVLPILQDLTVEIVEGEGEEDSDHVVWLRHLFQSPAPNWRNGEHRPIGRLIGEALTLNGASDTALADLRSVGLKVETLASKAKKGGMDGPHLVVANTHPHLSKLFEGTRFANVQWRDILGRAPGAWATGQQRFGSDYSGKAWAVPVRELPIGEGRFGGAADRNADRNSETGGGSTA